MYEEDGGGRRAEGMIVATDLAQIPPTRVPTSTAIPSISRAGLLVLDIPGSTAGDEILQEERGHDEERCEETDVGPGIQILTDIHHAPVRVAVQPQ